MPVFELIVVALLILLNGFFAMAELAVISSRRARLQAMADEGSRGARAALELLDDSGRFLSSVQIGITLVGILAGAYGGASLAAPLGNVLQTVPFMSGHAETIAFALVVAVITYASLVIGELVPKQVALAHAERIAAAVAVPMRALARVGAPLVQVLDTSTRVVLRVFGQSKRVQTITEDEIKMLLAEATEAGVVEHAERQMIAGVMRLGEMSVQAIMTPRPDITWLDLDEDLETNLKLIRESGHALFPASRGDLDELVGTIAAKDVLTARLESAEIDLQAVAREPIIVPESADVLQLVELIKRSPLHMAIVIDEYGTVQGLATETDVLEAIVGTLAEEGTVGEEEVVRREDGSWLMDGGIASEHMKDILGIKSLPDEGDFHTAAGFLLSLMAHVPSAGEYVDWSGFRFEVVDMDGNRIDKVLVTPLAPANGEAPQRSSE
ncbi:MAG: hemolysin family protein [Gammaproteobacteria bacterium]|nr:hemolysin family protein [Gammaproteobacteria bacterium]